MHPCVLLDENGNEIIQLFAEDENHRLELEYDEICEAKIRKIIIILILAMILLYLWLTYWLSFLNDVTNDGFFFFIFL